MQLSERLEISYLFYSTVATYMPQLNFSPESQITHKVSRFILTFFFGLGGIGLCRTHQHQVELKG
jgi:hypothetical protein